jgi:AcrR family transcriptional regulator
MVKQEKEIKERIIHATIELIKKHGDTSKITVRDIAASAGVGIGLINYHFQTKDNLINLCTLELIRYAIEQLGILDQNSVITPVDQMKTLGKGIASFMVMNPGVSRISITKDFVSPGAADNSVQVVKMFVPIARKILDSGKSDLELQLLLHMLVSSIEAAFLRRNILKETIGIDIENTEQRDRLVTFCIDQLFIK